LLALLTSVDNEPCVGRDSSRALSSRNYRLYFGGQIISLIGNWMTSTASLWLVYHLSSSPFLLGVVGFASQAPMFVLAPFAGVWVDRPESPPVAHCHPVPLHAPVFLRWLPLR
jgi:hypothetical protein